MPVQGVEPAQRAAAPAGYQQGAATRHCRQARLRRHNNSIRSPRLELYARLGAMHSIGDYGNRPLQR